MKALWRLGGKILERTREEIAEDNEEEDEDEEETREEEKNWRNNKKAEWLEETRNNPLDKLEKFSERILTLVAAGKSKYALEELALYLPGYPYHDSIGLNVLAGQLSLFLCQPIREEESSSSSSSSSESDTNDTKSKKRKRVVVAEPDISKLIIRCSKNDSQLFDQSIEYFKRAARLERKDDEGISLGEGKRWLNLLVPPSKDSQRSKSDDESDSSEVEDGEAS